jgi:hypothetical protein
MNTQQALASGMIASLKDIPADGCSGFFLKALSTREANSVDGYIDADYGVVMIGAAPSVRTPEGIGVGSTLDAVRAAYPNLIEEQGGPRTTVPGNPGALYEFAYNDTKIIVRMNLVTAGPEHCFN